MYICDCVATIGPDTSFIVRHVSYSRRRLPEMRGMAYGMRFCYCSCSKAWNFHLEPIARCLPSSTVRLRYDILYPHLVFQNTRPFFQMPTDRTIVWGVSMLTLDGRKLVPVASRSCRIMSVPTFAMPLVSPMIAEVGILRALGCHVQAMLWM